jgi:hypothetical protein
MATNSNRSCDLKIWADENCIMFHKDGFRKSPSYVTGEMICYRKKSRPQITQGQAQRQAIHSNHNPASLPVKVKVRHNQIKQCV